MNGGVRVSRIMNLLIVLALIVGSLSGCSPKQSQEEQLDAYINKYFIIDPSASIAVMVIDEGQPVYKKAFGYANIETLEKATPMTNYRLASITKMFTAMCVAILEEDGLITYDTLVKDILEDFPSYGDAISIQHLLQHRSGLYDFYDRTDLLDKTFDVDHQVLDSDVYEIVKKSEGLAFEPGQKHDYVDVNYILLGLIVEKVSGMTLTDYMATHIFEPLEMDNSLCNDTTMAFDIAHRALGTAKENDKYITKDQNFSSATRGDGNVYTSLDDMYKWDQGLYGNVLLSNESKEAHYKAPKRPGLYSHNYDFGWVFRNNAKKQLEMMHYGSSQGFSTVYIRIPEKKQAIVVLSNRNEADEVYDLHIKIRSIYGMPQMLY